MAYIYGAEHPSTEKTAAARVLAAEEIDRLERTVEGLPRREQAAFMAQFVEGVDKVTEAVIARNADAAAVVAQTRAEISGAGAPGLLIKSASAGRERVAKKSKARIRCHSCGAKLKARDAACRKCGRETELGAVRKAMMAGGVVFIGKSMRPRCPGCGADSRPSAKHCTSCGLGLLNVAQSVAERDRQAMLRKARQEPDPERREILWKAANPDIYGGQGGRAS